MPNSQNQRVCFRVENDWILLSEKLLGKVIIRAHKIGKINRKSDGKTQHRGFEFECERNVKIRSKLYDTSNFLEK